MAYITREKSAAVRKALKARFPDWKFSVSISHHSSLKVVIISAPIELLAYRKPGPYDDRVSGIEITNATVNQFWITEGWASPAAELLKEIKAICNEGNHDNSDIQSDYFDVGWYFSLSVGDWGRPFQFTGQQALAA